MASTDWVIGYAVEAESPSAGTWRDTRLGGYPLWPPGQRPNVATCPCCDKERVLVVQAFAPHSLHADRVILLFACNSVVCSRKPESWYAIRAFCRNEDDAPEKKRCEENAESRSMTEIVNWDTDSDDDGILNTSQSQEDGVEAFEQLLALQYLQISQEKARVSKGVSSRADVDKPLKGGPSSGSTRSCMSSACLKPYFVEVAMDPKESDVADDTGAVEKLIEAYKAEEAQLLKSGEVSQWEAEKDIEETDASRAVDDFRKVIERAPEQVLRYKFGGDPVWPSHPAPEPQRLCCPHCGEAQVFELQLLGSVLFYLKPESVVPSSQGEAALNFLALGVYSCEKDCGMQATGESGSGCSGKEFEYRTLEVRLQHDFW